MNKKEEWNASRKLEFPYWLAAKSTASAASSRIIGLCLQNVLWREEWGRDCKRKWHHATGETEEHRNQEEHISNRLPVLKNKRPTWGHLLFYFTSYVLNMFRTLIYPPTGACDYSVELPHWSYCSWFDVCWSFGVVGLEWYPCCRLISLRMCSTCLLCVQ